MATMIKLRNVLESIDDELRKYQFQKFDKTSDWKSGIERTDFQANVVPRILPGQVYFFIFYIDNSPSKIIDLPNSDRLRVFKNLSEAKAFVESFNQFQEFDSAMLVEYIEKDIKYIWPIKSGFDKVLIECMFKNRYDTFPITDKSSYEGFMKIWNKFGNTNKLKISRISLRKDISNKF